MPSGAKKRKAAKKKQQNQPNNPYSASSNSTHPNGGDDLKHQDDKESDTGEVNSPASQDHHSYHNPSTIGECKEFDEANNTMNLPSVERLKIDAGEVPNIVVEDENIDQVEKGLKIEYESDKKDEIFEHDETDGSSSKSSSSDNSSSDDESHGNKSSQAVVNIPPVVDSVNITESLSESQFEAINTLVDSLPSEKTSLSGAVESVVKVNGEGKDGISDAKNEENDDREIEKDSEVTKLLLTRADKTTSWKSCCGLFEVFGESSR